MCVFCQDSTPLMKPALLGKQLIQIVQAHSMQDPRIPISITTVQLPYFLHIVMLCKYVNT